LTTKNRLRAFLFGIAALLTVACSLVAKDSPNPSNPNQVRIVELQGTVAVKLHDATNWQPAQTNQLLHPLDRLRTGPNSRVALRWSGESVMSFGAQTELEILQSSGPDAENGLYLLRGIVSFFHRDKPGRIRVITRGAVAGVEGTEFVMTVDEQDRSTVSVIDGKVRFGNDKSSLLLTNGEQASMDVGGQPVRGTGFIANNLLQWGFYYPLVLDVSDLRFTADETRALEASLKEYGRGDVLEALALFPAQPVQTDNVRLFHAALLLGVGQVAEAVENLHAVELSDERATALRTLIAAVKRQEIATNSEPRITSDLLARSYYEQSRAVPEVSLQRALELAKRATQQSPQSGFAWARVAELELSFGRLNNAEAALNKSFEVTPRNPQALSLKGFILLIHNNPREAMDWFDRAIAVDSALANAWLGRGLCKIYLHDDKGGQEDLLIAAALEPQRAELRSYLGKAYATVNDYTRAAKELRLAKKLDPNDPTAWLYSALVKRNQNRINEAVRDLEKSAALNDNRSVYRSQLMLDQDQAVRSANLANIYRDAGMTDFSVREASRAVSYDYANYSAHLFLANSYSELTGPNQIFLRYETPMLIEYSLANLLAPASAGCLTPAMVFQDNSKFFQRDRLGLSSETTYLSRGAWFQEGEQYGVSGNLSYNLHASYATDPGLRASQHVDDDLNDRLLQLSLKQQITPADSVFVTVAQRDRTTGYLNETYTFPTFIQPFTTHEIQEPFVSLGYHHEWTPGNHTLFFFNRFDDTTSVSARYLPTFDLFRPDAPDNLTVTGARNLFMEELLTNYTTLYSAELQQIWQMPSHSTIVGGRAQVGNNQTKNQQDLASTDGAVFNTPATVQDVHTEFNRLSFYAYHNWTIVDPFQLNTGITYDRLRFPENNELAPITGGERETEQFSPKAGFIWTPVKLTTVRFAYTQSLGDSGLGQSTQIEPSQIAGFQQAFRSIIPDSVDEETPGAHFETFNLSLEQKFPTGTYLAVYGTILNSNLRRSVGGFDVRGGQFDWAIPTQEREKLNYNENTLQFTANQLVGDWWSFAAQYRVSEATLHEHFYELPDPLTVADDFIQRTDNNAILHQVRLNAFFNHPSGFFGEADAIWNQQSNMGYAPDLPGDDFWQFNLYAGYRFLHRRAEATLAILNITDQDYRLNPLNLYEEFPRSRTLMARLRVNF
jgi:tetratricopeptide (TPR) repeat protein